MFQPKISFQWITFVMWWNGRFSSWMQMTNLQQLWDDVMMMSG